MRVTTTIPAEGVKKPVKLTGRSVIVESSSVYTLISEVPTFSFNPGPNNNPIYPRSVYVNPEGMFNQIVIEGTAESAGDRLTLYSVDECLTTDLNINLNQTSEADFKATFKKSVLDSVETLSLIEIQKNDKLPTAMYVTCADDDLRYGFDVDPVQGSDSLGHILKSGEMLKVDGLLFITNFRFINNTGAVSSGVNFTMEY